MRRLVIPLIIILGIFAWLVFHGHGKGKENVYSGTIEARDADLGSLTGGRVTDVLVEEGDSVRAGQVLVRFDSYLLKPQIQEQEARVEQMRANLERVMTGPRREQVERARIDYEQAERERVRQDTLLKQAVTSQADYDRAAANAQSLYQVYEELRRGSRTEDEQQAQAQLQAEEGNLAVLQRQLEETEVRAPADGIIQTMDLRPGDLIAPNQPVAVLLEPDELWVRLYVPETRLGLIKVGQSVDVHIDTFPKRAFKAHVQSVSDRAEYTPRNVQTPQERKDQVFAVRLKLDPAPELKAGMTATVRLE
ncbi:MAG TPA: HlyD family efflux transporter periplasmic adaptor subunit [Candidatus Krumholzibacteria bacterium]|nr:HlyD family efflux transporter periplasmic adaptor subunit [Candidatus Krumholzibacteria bacterium]